MSRKIHFHRLMACAIALTLIFSIAGCSKEVRKKKYMAAGKAAFDQGKYNEATIQFSNAIQVDGKDAEAHYQLSRVYLRQSLWSLGFQELMKTIDLKPEHYDAQIDLGNMFLAGKRVEDAQQRADFVLKGDPNSYGGTLLQADIFFGRGDEASAMEWAQKALKLDEKRVQAYVTLAQLYSKQKDNANAEAMLTKALSLEPKNSPLRVMLASFYNYVENWKGAEQVLKDGIQVDPKSAPARAALARFYMQRKDLTSAEAVLQQAKKDLGNDDPEAFRLVADFYTMTGQIDRATSEFKTLLEQHPNDVKLRNVYAELLTNMNKLDEAQQINDKTLTDNAKDPGATLIKGMIMVRRGQHKDAIPVLQEAVKDNPSSAPAHHFLGIALANNGDLSGAQTEWAAVLKQDPTYADTHLAMANLAMAKGDYKQLADSAEQMLKYRPNLPEGYVFRALANIQRNDAKTVEDDLKKAMEVAPNNPLGFVRMGEWKVRQKKYDEAQKLFAQSLQMNADTVDAVKGQVLIAIAQKKTDQIASIVQAALARSPKNPDYHLMMGNAYVAKKDDVNGEAEFRKALELNPNYNEGYAMLVSLQMRKNLDGAALVTAKEWSAKSPADVRPFMTMGSLYEKAGKLDDAKIAYEAALRIQPSYGPAANNLAAIMLDHNGSIDQAVSLAQVARQTMPENANAADTLGWAYYNKGTYRFAAELLEEATKKRPDNPEYFYHLGLTYAKLDDRAKAVGALKKAMALDPNFKYAKQTQENLDRLQ
jgi:tetratricopeptide (TPR) repeat protein